MWRNGLPRLVRGGTSDLRDFARWCSNKTPRRNADRSLDKPVHLRMNGLWIAVDIGNGGDIGDRRARLADRGAPRARRKPDGVLRCVMATLERRRLGRTNLTVTRLAY